MDIAKWKLEIQVVADKIKKAYKDFLKHDNARKNPAYKVKRLAELEADWNLYTELDEKLMDAIEDADPGLTSRRAETESIYAKYRDALMLLHDIIDIDESNQANRDEDGGEMNDEITKFTNIQYKRFESLHRAIEQTQDAMDNDIVSQSYCKIKMQKLTSHWERISSAHETMGSNWEKLSKNYLKSKDALEIDFEETLVMLQEILEPQSQGDNIKLPRIVIPKFEGDYFTWVNFRDLFIALIINNKKLSNTQRMQLLKTSLGGEAESLISDLTLSNEDFLAAWNRLKHRYENAKVIVSQHLKTLITQPNIKNDNVDSKQVKKLLDTTEQILLALKNLGRPVQHWDDWIVITISHKFNDELRREWEKKVGHTTTLPKWSDLKEFLEEEYRISESLENRTKRKASTNQAKPINVKSNHVSIDKKSNCPNCKKQHSLFSCGDFKKMTTDERWILAKKEKLCFKCLQHHDDKLSCNKEKPCKKCSKTHNTWLHDDKPKSKQINSNCSTKDGDSVEVSTNVATIQHQQHLDEINLTAAHSSSSKQQVLLATALVAINDMVGKQVLLRTLIDFGSQGSMITDDAITLLQLKPVISNSRIRPLGGGPPLMAKTITITVRPRFQSKFKLVVECHCLKKLTRTLPNENLNTDNWLHIKGLQWADPKFNKVGPIDLLLGADTITDLMMPGLIKGTIGEPIAQQTELGWIMSGKLDSTYQSMKGSNCLLATTTYQDEDLKRFWELEDLTPERSLTEDEIKCDQFFNNTYSRDEKGHFTVKIPFKDGYLNPEHLGNSRKQALARFGQLERKLANNSKLKTEYVRVMNEYIQLGHMIEVNTSTEKLFYIPHHAVLKPESLTTKTRIVFDASAKSSSGVSLNECMYVGSKQQDDLFVILTRWRRFMIVFKADIEKMYRQIAIDKNDQKYHTVIWRNDPLESLKEYQLTTVTFGTRAAPYLATRTLKQIGMDGEKEFPVAAEIIKKDFYVDDLISGADNLEQAISTKNGLTKLLNGGGLKLRKWTSNNQEFLNTLPLLETETSLQMFSDNETSNTLGLQWNPKNDVFSFKVSWYTSDKPITKRLLLSEASKLFDPLGWLAPVVIKSKLFMQKVWCSAVDWDEEIPEDIRISWIEYRDSLVTLGEIEIPRWIQFNNDNLISLHGFCDASEKAYAAVVYTRVQASKQITIKLIASKTRVSPKATKTTLPRLELCGAVLLKNLMTHVQGALMLGEIKQYAWSDSMITLGWLKADPGKWKTFVANRVAEIHNKNSYEWNYVKSDENPADCASRGIMPNELKNHKLWWTGPAWLQNDPDSWKTIPVPEHEVEKRKEISINIAIIENDIMKRFSSWNRLIRVTALLKRWKNKLRGPLVTKELKDAAQIILKQGQKESFGAELRRLEKNKTVKRNSGIMNLNPFIGEDGLLRVGGRLEQSDLSYESKHPIILPADHHLTKLIIRAIHYETAHGGPQLMTTLLRKTYWIIRGKRAVNNIYKSCVICKRQAGKIHNQLMGELPVGRITFERAFLHTGVDYAGPMQVRSSRLRKAPTVKGYIALFVCFATKAVHLEIVSDQSSDAFLAALQRFTARRGLCSDMYSDNGSNFQGASNQLERDLYLARNQELANYVANKGISWHFIPPDTPHQGGLWERNIGCMKTHLKKVLGTTQLTFEEYGTILCQIEASLNSRPIGPLTEDPENLNVLTPGHFLIGDALLAIPQPTLADNNRNMLHRWNHLQLLNQHFWKRWSSEYLNQLQQRSKWNTATPNVNIGDLVLIKDEDLPPRKWMMGRIVETHPGKDGKVRVASIKTATKTTTRAVNKICPLIDADNTSTVSTKDDKREPKKSQPTKKKTVTDPLANYWNQRTLRPRPLRSTLWLALVALLIILIGGNSMPTNRELPINITEFSDHPGIYFENLGHAGVITSEWHIYLNIDLSTYRHEFKFLQNAVIELMHLCEDNSHCADISSHLQMEIKEMKQFNDLIQTNGENRLRRHAPLAIVGWMQHEVFGVMDQDNADHIESQFKKVQTNEEHLLQLIKNQTSIADITVDLMKTTQNEINQNYAKIGNLLSTLQNETNLTKRTEQMLGLAIHLSLLIRKLEKFQSNLVNMLTDLNQGHVNSHMFTPDKFMEQLGKINNNMPVGSRVPEHPQDDLKPLYKLLIGKARVMKERIVFDMKLPLISTLEYQLFKIIPVPTKHGIHRVSIIPDTKFLMITLEKDKFYQMNENEYHSCLKSTNSKTICKINHPSYNAQSNRSRCERELLRQATKLSEFCDVKITDEEDIWIRLQQKNEWIYGLKKELILNLVCNNEVFPLKIQGSGIIQLQPGCNIVQPEMTITAETHKISKGTYNFNPMLNLSASVVKNNIRVMNFTIDHSLQLHNLHKQLTEVKDQTHLERIQHYTHYGIHTTLWLTLVGITIVCWIKRHLLKKLYTMVTTFVVTSTGQLVNASWPNWRINGRQITRSANNRTI